MIQSAKGTYDLLPSEAHKWHFVESVLKACCERYNYKEIRTPLFESTELFVRGVGESTDIVTKEMYTFDDKGGRSMTLRPEGTAPVARSYVQHKLYAQGQPLTKLYYMGPMFRYERQQKGRYRQFNQFGFEALGGTSPQIDAEVIALSVEMIESLGLKEVKVAINTLGDEASRNQYREALINHFKPHIDTMCRDCQNRLETNPLRVLDCKVDTKHEAMESAPKMLDYLNEASQTHFNQVLALLNDLEIEYVIDHNLVRGLDYYNHTVFEVMSNVEGFGAQTTLGGGGRYNGLIESIGGPETPAMGVAFGMERLILALEAEGKAFPGEKPLDVFIVSMNDQTDAFAFKLLHQLRKQSLKVDKDFFGRKVRAQFKQADRSGARFTIIVGEDELANGEVSIKNMNTQQQTTIKIENILAFINETEVNYA